LATSKVCGTTARINDVKQTSFIICRLEGGHGFDASENKQDKELTDVLAFALWQTGHPDYQPKK
jgi:prolyl oligopeptidase